MSAVLKNHSRASDRHAVFLGDYMRRVLILLVDLYLRWNVLLDNEHLIPERVDPLYIVSLCNSYFHKNLKPYSLGYMTDERYSVGVMPVFFLNRREK